MPAAVLFYLFAALVLGSALYVALTRHVVRAAFGLFVTFLGIAALYGWLGADFLAGTQLMVYAGGILVLMLFAVMLTRHALELQLPGEPTRWVPAALVGFGVAALLVVATLTARWAAVDNPPPPQPTTAALGQLLLTRYVLPFEIASVVLLAVLVGATVISRRDTGDRP